MNLHIHAPKGKYIGQVRRWVTVYKSSTSPSTCLSRAALFLGSEYLFARVLFVTDCGYYDPIVVMEGRKL